MAKSEHSNLNLLQNVGTIMALSISILALCVSVYEANIMRSQQKATVWPYLWLSQGYNSEGFSFNAGNNGIGPALIKSVEVRYKGELIKDMSELLDKIKPDHKLGYNQLRMSSFNQTVMKAGEERQIFFMPWNEETREMVKSMQYVSIKVQYCSVLEDCWVFDLTNNTRKEEEFKAEKEFEN